MRTTVIISLIKIWDINISYKEKGARNHCCVNNDSGSKDKNYVYIQSNKT